MSECKGDCGEDTCVTPGCGEDKCSTCGRYYDECDCEVVEIDEPLE